MAQSIDHRVKYTSMRTVSLTDQPDLDTSTERSVSPNHTTLTSEPTPKDDHSPAVWGLGWRSPTLMVVLYLCGVAFSVGHHLYYNSLDNIHLLNQLGNSDRNWFRIRRQNTTCSRHRNCGGATDLGYSPKKKCESSRHRCHVQCFERSADLFRP
jgi:hypothetical protein